MSEETKLREIKPEHLDVVADLRRLADDIESGKEKATSVFCIVNDRVGGLIFTRMCGERLTYSGTMGLCSYASHSLYRDIKQPN